MWSFGATLIETITGNPPYSDLNHYSAFFKIIEDEVIPIPDSVSDNLREVLVLCFEKDYKKWISV